MYPKPSKSTGAKSDATEKPFEHGQSPVENKRKAASKEPISLLKEDGFLYGANDVQDGEYSAADINKRVAAQAAAFVEKYQTTSMGPGDAKPIPGDKLKPV